MQFYSFIKGIANVILRPIFRIKVSGKENIPENSRIILCANHAHVFDPIMISMVFPRQVHWMAKKELFKNSLLNWFFNKLGAFPVNREESDLSAVRNSLKLLRGNNVLGIFIEGTRVKEVNLDNAKPGVALIGVKSQSLVLPVYIEGRFKPFGKISIYFGQTIDFSENYNKRLTTEDYGNLSKDILKSIYKLKPVKGEMQ